MNGPPTPISASVRARQLLVDSKLSLAELQDLIGMHRAKIGRFRNSRGLPSTEEAQIIIRLLS